MFVRCAFDRPVPISLRTHIADLTPDIRIPILLTPLSLSLSLSLFHLFLLLLYSRALSFSIAFSHASLYFATLYGWGESTEGDVYTYILYTSHGSTPASVATLSLSLFFLFFLFLSWPLSSSPFALCYSLMGAPLSFRRPSRQGSMNLVYARSNCWLAGWLYLFVGPYYTLARIGASEDFISPSLFFSYLGWVGTFS